jgi:hypothetical protein
MNPLKGFREDLVNFVGRLREQVYPDLTNTDVAVILRQIAQSFHQTESQAKAQARDEAIREAAARGFALPTREEGIRDWEKPLTHGDLADMKRQLEERRAKAASDVADIKRHLEERREPSREEMETQFAADRCAGESLPIGRDL